MNGRAIAGVFLLVSAMGLVGSRADVLKIDPVHSRIGFTIGHLGISTVTGSFMSFSGTVQYAEGDLGSLKAEVTIQSKSIDTGWPARDTHVRSGDFLSADAYPEIIFRSSKVEEKDGQHIMTGTLKMHGVSKEVSFPVKVSKVITDPWGKKRVGLAVDTKLDRHDYGVGSDKAVDKAVGSEVTASIQFEAVGE
jgi:polyisoprenoid-binding protein YceI